ncbi:uncharacterized protein BDR25DRAFT_366887 [Lindgomyces ingoldianus]|uniref:Uncharacterized protein n=1 Tax=Lindgomyces ingoldianus TaxID=673940 RepID=A0ACB6QYN0_9PLEO|nr:uncharacterized protein BDR25DRAFT_366887 [Lindgomyces ingoldianus]KAF2472128.1 hypothetical protein BDR25DRAFT_366887 [Lindgomyces ingoldianus]
MDVQSGSILLGKINFLRRITDCKGTSLSHSTLDALYESLRVKWQLPYDAFYPFGDHRRAGIETVWTFDLDNDMLLFSKRDCGGRLALPLVRQRPITISDFEPLEPPSQPTLGLGDDFMLMPPYWEPKLHVLERNKAFLSRVLNDFGYQWRHILRSRYNDLTFRKLARDVIRIATLDFNVVEITKPRHGQTSGPMVWIDSLPEWDPFDSHFTRVGQLWVAMSQDLKGGLSLVRRHISTKTGNAPNSYPQSADVVDTYLILSVRHIILCRAGRDKVEWTQPEPCFNGVDSLSGQALDMLLSATSTSPCQTPIHNLPTEIQNKIIQYTSQGSVEAARMGCILGLGLPFLWKDGDLPLEREEAHRNRSEITPAESQLWFDGYMSGISYKGNRHLDIGTFSD